MDRKKELLSADKEVEKKREVIERSSECLAFHHFLSATCRVVLSARNDSENHRSGGAER